MPQVNLQGDHKMSRQRFAHLPKDNHCPRTAPCDETPCDCWFRKYQVEGVPRWNLKLQQIIINAPRHVYAYPSPSYAMLSFQFYQENHLYSRHFSQTSIDDVE